MPIEQQWYWEFNCKEAKAKGYLPEYLSMMVADDGCFTPPPTVKFKNDVDLGYLFPSLSATQELIKA